MSSQDILFDANKPVIYFFGDPDGLGLPFIETILGFSCSVLIIGDSQETWIEKLGTLSVSPNLFFARFKDSFEVSSLGYIVWIDNNLTRSEDDFAKLEDLASLVPNKKIYLYPYAFEGAVSSDFSARIKRLQLIDPESQFIYVGDVLGKELPEKTPNVAIGILKDLLTRNTRASHTQTFNIYPTPGKEVAKKVCTSLFSFGLVEKHTALIPKALMVEDYESVLADLFPDHKIFKDPVALSRTDAKVGDIIRLPGDLETLVLQTINWYKETHPLKMEEKPKVSLPKISKKEKQIVTSFNLPISPKSFMPKKPKVKIKLWPFLAVLGLFLLPFTILGMSLASFYGGYALAKLDKLPTSKVFFSAAKGMGYASEKSLSLYAQVPVIKKIIVTPLSLAALVNRSSGLVLRGYDLLDNFKALAQGVFQDQPFSVVSVSEKISGELDYLYTQSGFLVGELNNYPKTTQKLVDKYIGLPEIATYREKIIYFKSFLYYLPDILGQFNPRTYLVLLQNNMELRPTGGFIGSFALIKFDQGRLIDINVQDVYSADGQLKGYVEPPEPLTKYMAQASWYLRDSNWDPDFSVTAQKAQWFLDKEINQKVDGVFGVDLELVRGLLSIFGPVTLTDYSQTITSANFYEKTQYEVENDFFPGSSKKTSFLTSLTRQLLTQVTENIGKSHSSLARTIYKNLDEKHIQIYLNNLAAQKIIVQLKVDGGVQKETCSNNCYADWVGYVDANLGVNKANYYLQRSVNLTTYLNNQKLQRYLTVDLKNTANPSLGDKVRYGTYLRVLVPLDSLIFNAKVGDLVTQAEVPITEATTVTYKEAGVWVEVMPGETKRVIFSWQGTADIDFSREGFYQVTVRKQAGTLADPFSWAVFMPNSVTAQGTEKFSLTKEGFYLYNTSLVRDITPRIYWK